MIKEFSRLGLGLYQGPETDAGDEALLQVLRRFVETGGNVIDCAPNYRNERSERLLARILSEYADRPLFISTKGGFVPFEFSNTELNESDFVSEHYFSKGLIAPHLFDQEYFQTFDPVYLNHRLRQTLENLRRNQVDVYYLHNPEYLLRRLGRKQFLEQMRSVFSWLQLQIKQGSVRFCGISAWEGFFEEHTEITLQLAEFVQLADEQGLSDRFRFIQFPFNLGLTKGFFSKTQLVDGQNVSLMRAIGHFQLTAVSSAPLGQGRLTGIRLPERLAMVYPGLTAAQTCLAFVLSAPSLSCTLFGTNSLAHLHELLEVHRQGHYSEEQFMHVLNS